MTNLKTKILETVRKNNVTMIPRWQFVLYSALGVVGLIFSFLLMIFVLSLILFLLSRYGFMYMPFFGLMATMRALSAIPLVLLLCTVVLLITIEVISRYYSFAFRRPLAVTLLFLTTVAAIISFIISETGVHSYVRGYAHDHHIVVMERMYDRPLPFKPISGVDIIRGEVISSSPTTTMLELFDGTTVIAYATTTGEKILVMPKIGEDVMVFGTFIGERFEIVDVRITPRTPFGERIHRRGMPMMNQNGTGTRRAGMMH
jgi:hypothetical protein